MSQEKEKSNLANTLKKYLSEVVVIFIGISMSFLFDEWRQGRNDNATARNHLMVVRANLVQDTVLLTAFVNMGKIMAGSAQKMAYFQSDSEILDSVDFHIDNAASYLNFESNQTGFEEIKEAAHTDLIKDDTLRRAILSYYTVVVPSCLEWCAVDENYTMTQLIPEMSIYFPVVPDTLHLISASEKARSLRAKKLRNLLLTSAVYKQSTIRALATTKGFAQKVIVRIDKELNKK